MTSFYCGLTVNGTDTDQLTECFHKIFFFEVHVTLRFVTNSAFGVRTADDLCKDPKTCMTVVLSDSIVDMRAILELREPHFLVNILKVG